MLITILNTITLLQVKVHLFLGPWLLVHHQKPALFTLHECLQWVHLYSLELHMTNGTQHKGQQSMSKTTKKIQAWGTGLADTITGGPNPAQCGHLC